VVELKWTREAVLDQVDMPFLRDLRRAWTECPPPRRLFAAYLGYKPPSRPSNDYHELLAMFPNGTIK
jgi:hypothetical protein